MHQLDRHSLKILNQIREYDSFLDSLKTIADMGCGAGEDIAWFATLETRDDPPRPYNYNCFAVDNNPRQLQQIPNLKNIRKIERNFNETNLFPVTIDLMLSHDSLQYSPNPLQTLKNWNEMMTPDGMLIISLQQTSGVENNRYYSRTSSGCYYHYTPTNLLYMLAVNGFDCNDAYLLKQFNDPWIHIAVYKSGVAPMNPETTTWVDLAEKNLLNLSVVKSIHKNGYVRQEEIVYPWLDRENYFVDYVSQWENLPGQPEVPEVQGVFNKEKESKEHKIKQAPAKVKQTDLLKPIGVLRPPKDPYVK